MHRLAAALVLLAATPAAAQDWQTFDSPSFGFSIEVPSALFDSREAGADGRSVTWLSDDGSVRLEAFSMAVGVDITPATILSQRQDTLPERQVTYRTSGKGWAVASGYETPARQRIFYERFESAPDGSRWAGFSLSWDASRRQSVDPTVDRIANSLSVTP